MQALSLFRIGLINTITINKEVINMDRLTTVNGNNNIELVINESRVRIKDTDTLAVAKKLKEYEKMG